MVENQKVANGVALFDVAFHKRTGYHLADVWPMEYAKAVTVPTLVAQVRDDFLTKPSNVQEIYDTLSSRDKKLFWIEGTDQRFQGYNYFGKKPEGDAGLVQQSRLKHLTYGGGRKLRPIVTCRLPSLT